MITCILPDRGDIVSIAVAPALRRMGVGRALVLHTFRELKSSDVNAVELRIRATNIVGLRFWESFGFSPIGMLANFYRDGAETLQMRKHP